MSAPETHTPLYLFHSSTRYSPSSLPLGIGLKCLTKLQLPLHLVLLLLQDANFNRQILLFLPLR